MRFQTIFIALLSVTVSACQTSLSDLVRAPRAQAGGAQSSGSSELVTTLDLDPEVFNMATPGPVALAGVTPCRLAEIVFVQELALRVGCTASGDPALSLFSDFESGPALFDLTVATLRQGGADVSLSDGVVIVSGEVNADASGQGSGVNGDTGGPSLPAGVVLPLDPDRAEELAREIQIGAPRVATSVVGDVDSVADLVEALALDVMVAPSGSGRVALIGTLVDVGIVEQSLTVGDFGSLVLPVSGDPQLFDDLAATYGVSVVLSEDLLLLVSGDRDLVQRFGRAVQDLGLISRQRSVSAAFAYGLDSDLLNFRSQISGQVQAGEITVNLGSDTSMTVALERLRDFTQVRVSEEPSISVRDGVRAEFVSGRQVPVQTEIDAEGRSSVEYRDTGTTLRVLTRTRPGGQVSVDLYLEVSSVDGAGVLDNPTFASRSLQTSVVVYPGDVIVLSGFSAGTEERSTGSDLFLPRQGRNGRREEMVILLTVQ